MSLLHHVIRLKSALASRVRNCWFRALGTEIQGYVWLRRISIPRNWSDIRLYDGVALDDGVILLCSGAPRRKKLVVGAGTYVNRFTMIDASERIEIGKNCMIGPHCYITDHDHGLLNDQLRQRQPLLSAPVEIGDEVWLGAGVIVLKGVTIGDGAIVGAGAVVTKNVASGTKVAGVPAEVIQRSERRNAS